jgi:hypothetical protein
MGTGCHPQRLQDALVGWEGESCGGVLRWMAVLECKQQSALAGSCEVEIEVAVVAVVVASCLSHYTAAALVEVMTIVAVVIAGFGQLRPLVLLMHGEGATRKVPGSDATLSPPAISRRLEMDGSDGLCSSAGGDGGDRGCWC